MLYHFCGKIVKRSGGKDATAACAYNTRSCVYDRTTGLEWNHTYHKDKAVYNHRYLPADHPDWAEVQKDKKGRDDYGEFWNLVEEKENRKNSQFARAIDLAYQSEFTPEQNRKVLERWIEKNWTSRGLSVDVSEHHGHVEEDGTSNSNDHAHLLIPTRKMDKTGWTTKDRESNDHTYWQEVIRRSWAEENNLMFDEIFIEKHKEEYDQIEKEIKNDYENQDELHREVLNRLYDEHPDEWIYISEKTLPEQREEVDLWLDEEEAKEKPNKKRIERFEKKFQELDREAQQHMGKAHRMAKKGKETKRKKYRSEQNQADAKAAEVNSQTTELEQNAAAEDPMLSDNEINFEETLSGVAGLSAERDPEPEAQIDFSKMDVSEEELEATLKDDPEYQKLIKERNSLIKEIEESERTEQEIEKIRKEIMEIETLENLNKYRNEVLEPRGKVVQKEAEKLAIFEDIKYGNEKESEIKIVIDQTMYSELEYEHTDDALLVVSKIEMFHNRKENEVFDSENEKQQSDLEDVREKVSGFSLAKWAKKIKEVFTKIKEKAAEIIANSPLRIFKVFRFQEKTVNERELELKNLQKQKKAEQTQKVEQKPAIPEQKQFRIEDTKLYHRIVDMTPVEWNKFMENYEKRYSYVDNAVGEYGKILKSEEMKARAKWVKMQSKPIIDLFVKQRDMDKRKLNGLGSKPTLEKESHNIFGHTYYAADGESYRDYFDYRVHQNSLITKWENDYNRIKTDVNYWNTAIKDLQEEKYVRTCNVIQNHFSGVWNQVKDGGNRLLDIDKEFEPFRLTKKIVETLKPVKDQEYKAYRAQKTLEKTNDKNIGMGRS